MTTAMPLLGDHHGRLAHRGTSIEHRQIVAQHDLFHSNDELPPERTARVKPGEVLALEALLLQQRHRQRVADDQGRGRARRRRKVVWTGLFPNGRIQGDIAVTA